MVQDELKPMIDDARQTIATVRRAATFMSENVVAPVIQTSSRLAGYRRIVQVLLGRAPRAAAGSDNDASPARHLWRLTRALHAAEQLSPGQVGRRCAP
jgi:hypothetical protein